MGAGDDQVPCKVDARVLDDPSNEEKDPFEYFVQAVAHLWNVLHADHQVLNVGNQRRG